MIALDLANVSNSGASRQLAVIRAGPGLPLPAAPSLLCPFLVLFLLTVPILTAGQVRRKLKLCVTSSHPALLDVKVPASSLGNKTVFLWSTCMTKDQELQQRQKKTLLWFLKDLPQKRRKFRKQLAAEFSLRHVFWWSSGGLFRHRCQSPFRLWCRMKIST